MERIRRQYFKKLPPKSKSVARPGKWGNPFKVIEEDGAFWVKDKEENYWGNIDEGYHSKEAAAKKAVSCFQGYLAAKVMKKELLLSEFEGVHHVACFCKLEDTCHADVIIDFVRRYKNGQSYF